MYTENLKEFCKNVKPTKMAVTKTASELILKDELFKETEFLNVYQNPPIVLRVFCVMNDVYEIPKCDSESCFNSTRYNKAYPNKGFALFCSEECSKNNKKKSKKFEILKDRDWLYEQRMTLKKSKELIAEELGCSITPVNKWLKIHDIPDIKYNESNPLSMARLKDKEFLYKEHKINHRTCEDIANELNVSKSTVSVFLSKHNIIANESNSYDRSDNTTSAECMEIVNFIQTFYDKQILLNKRNVIGSLELDIYLPESKIAIEYNGIYSHLFRPDEKDFSRRKDAKYHLYKTEKCEELGIQLIHIFSSQWKSNKEVWKSFIKNKLGFTENKLYARQCEVKEISIHEKNIFLDENHIQGRDKSKIKLGLFYDNKLVSVMTFGTPRYNKNYSWELIRFCTKNYYSVVGAFSKLLSHFRNNYPGSIISYANRTYSNGHLYEKNGFTLLGINKPSYYYVDVNKEQMQHKTNFKKKILLQKIDKPDWTERQLADHLGYKIIFDCGTKSYVYDN